MSCDFVKHHFKTNEEAEQALSHMRSIAEQYGYATVRDFHKFIGLAVIPEGSDRYGLSYKDLMEANVVFGMYHISPGVTERYHYIDFPEAPPYIIAPSCGNLIRRQTSLPNLCPLPFIPKM